MIYSVFDIEANGLLENATKIHCLCIHKVVNDKKYISSTTDYELMRQFFLTESILVGHNIQRYDIPLVEKILNIKIKARLVDTLPLSWYLYPNRLKHGLEEWGSEFGIQKPPIVDWDNLPAEQYIYRCSEDVKINVELFGIQIKYLKNLYLDISIDKILRYIEYKMDCAREQEEIKWKINVPETEKNFQFFIEEMERKRLKLSELMPPSYTYKVKSKPKVMNIKDGSVSELGKKWQQFLIEQNLPEYHNNAVKIIDKTNLGNPGSPEQLKNWLFSLGWKPTTFKYDIKDGKKREIPQVSSDDGTGICLSVKKLFIKYPYLIELEDFYVLKHRKGILKGFLEEKDESGFVKAEISGLTNTLRFQHKKPLANLPTIPKKYWEKIRGVLISPSDEYELCGADMSSLEDNTARHYMYYFDPNYVNELSDPNYDPHLDIAFRAGLLTEEQVEEHKLYDKSKGKEGVSYKAIRLKAKKVNFACKYGAGPPKLSLTGNIPLSESKIFHEVYWTRNKSIRQVAASCITKLVNNQMWLYNPVSKFWYSLRADKDKFSTLNQSTAVYCFDTWNRHVREKGWKLCGQFHDEIIIPILKTERESLDRDLNITIEETNNELKLNVSLKISIDYGNSYADIH